MNLKTRTKRIELGVCIGCGGELDTDGKWCSKCRKKERDESKIDRDFYLSNKICPYCRKETLFGSERACPECRAKRTETVNRTREKNKIQYNANLRKSRSVQRIKRKESGKCIRCGKRVALSSHVYCKQCLIKKREYERKQRENKGITIPRSERAANGLCYFCGNPIDRDGRACQTCADKMTANLPEKRGGGVHWKKYNELIFRL